MTDLQIYLDETGEKQIAFAARIETTPATVSRLCAGKLKPKLDLALRIERETKGRVPASVWVGDVIPAREAASA